MRIGILAYVLRQTYCGGIKTYLYNIIKELEKIDNENEYFLYVPCEVELPFSSNPRWHIRICKGLINKSGTLWQFFNAIRYLRTDKVDIFWATENLLPNSFRKLNIRTILTIHDVVPYIYPEKLDFINFIFFKLFGKITIKNADLIITVSKATKDKLQVVFEECANKEVKVVYNGVDASVFKKLDKEECKEYCSRKFNLNKDYILSVSVIKPTKNIEGILKAFRAFKEKYECRLQLVFAGSHLCGRFSILKTLKSLNFKENEVKFVGFVDINDLVRLYNGATLFISLPIDEGFGLPVLEAIMCGVPVICSDIPALREIADGISTFVKYANYDIIADQMEKIYANQEDKLDYSIISNIVQRFSWKAAAEKVKDIFT